MNTLVRVTQLCVGLMLLFVALALTISVSKGIIFPPIYLFIFAGLSLVVSAVVWCNSSKVSFCLSVVSYAILLFFIFLSFLFKLSIARPRSSADYMWIVGLHLASMVVIIVLGLFAYKFLIKHR